MVRRGQVIVDAKGEQVRTDHKICWAVREWRPAAACLLLMGLLSSCGGGNDPNPVECNAYPAQATSPYVLPYTVGTTRRASNTTAHSLDHLYAVDFLMPIGSTITAARAGRVYKTEGSFFDSQHGLYEANYVFVLHDDNTLGIYGHMTHNGPLVSQGDVVTQGPSLGLSGDSGLSTEPHLHFEVMRCTATAWSNGADCAVENQVSTPVVFRNTTATTCGLQAGEYYTAQPY